MENMSFEEFLDNIDEVKGLNKSNVKAEYAALKNDEEKKKYYEKIIKQAQARIDDYNTRLSKKNRTVQNRRWFALGEFVEKEMERTYDEKDFEELKYQLTIIKSTSEKEKIYISIGKLLEEAAGRELEKEDVSVFKAILLQNRDYFFEEINSLS